MICLNCGHHTDTGFKYCISCGQENKNYKEDVISDEELLDIQEKINKDIEENNPKKPILEIDDIIVNAHEDSEKFMPVFATSLQVLSLIIYMITQNYPMLLWQGGVVILFGYLLKKKEKLLKERELIKDENDNNDERQQISDDR